MAGNEWKSANFDEFGWIQGRIRSGTKRKSPQNIEYSVGQGPREPSDPGRWYEIAPCSYLLALTRTLCKMTIDAHEELLGIRFRTPNA